MQSFKRHTNNDNNPRVKTLNLLEHISNLPLTKIYISCFSYKKRYNFREKTGLTVSE